MNHTLRFVTNVDKNGHISYINDEYRKWIGYSVEEIIQQPTSILRAPSTSPEIQATILSECQANRPVSMVIEEVSKNGTTYWVEMACQPIFITGEYQGYTSVKRLVEDPTAVKNAAKLYQQIAQGQVIFYNGEWVSKAKHQLLALLGLHKASLNQKILFSTALISALILGGAFINEQHEINKIEANAAQQHTHNITEKLDNLLTKKAEIGLTNAIGIIHPPAVRQAIANSDQAALAELLAHIGDDYKALSDLQNIKLHFTNEQKISFYKSWLALDKQKLSDLSNRGYLAKLAKEQKPMIAYAVSSAGFNIKSMLPVMWNGNYEGSVEFIQGVGSLHRDFASTNQQYLVAISRDYALAGDEFQAKNADNIPVTHDKKWVVGNNKQFSLENAGKHIEALKQIDINALFKQGHLITDTHFHMAQPIYDGSKKLMGYHIVSEDITKYQALMAELTSVAENTFYGILLSVVSLMLLMTLLLWTVVVKPIRKTQETMEQAALNSDLFARIHTYGNDEIKQMALAYNRQSMLAQVAISEVNSAMEKIVSGQLDYQIEFPFQSDFGMLKNRINQTSDGLKTTFDAISEVMQDLQNGEFSKQHKHQLPGAYGKVVDDCLQAMSRLGVVFNEINQIMGYAARGKFDERIQSFAKGDIETLQQTINQSLQSLQAGFADIVLAAKRLAQGDFSQSITQQYEFTMEEAKQAINESISGLTQALTQVAQAATEVREGVSSVAEGTQSLNQRTQEQAASLEETSAAMEQTTSQIRSNLDNTRVARQIAQSQNAMLQDANHIMDDTKQSMTKIQSASDQIKEITSLIDSIAFQTNLLALNAAVEAARAGEHGRGFAVVAGEVRNLAGKSADAAKQISTLVGQTSSAIHIGVEQVDKVGSSLDQITTETQRMLDIVSEVSQASQEQALGVDEVNKAITQIDGATQQNAALVEENTATTETLMDSAQTLQNAISSFKLRR